MSVRVVRTGRVLAELDPAAGWSSPLAELAEALGTFADPAAFGPSSGDPTVAAAEAAAALLGGEMEGAEEHMAAIGEGPEAVH